MKSVNTGIAIGLVGLAVIGLSACAAEKSEPAASSTTAVKPASATTTAGATTTTAASSATPTTSTTTSTTTTSTTTATTSTTPTSATGSPMVGGMTECTKAALAQPATQAAQALGPNNVYAVDQLNCADGWAVTSGILASKDNPQMGAPTSFVFEQEGQFWVPKDKAKVCGTNPVTSTPPADALIPSALFLSGCAAG